MDSKVQQAMQVHRASYLDKNNILWKWIDGKIVGKKAMRDPDHKGFRYIWDETDTLKEFGK